MRAMKKHNGRIKERKEKGEEKKADSTKQSRMSLE